MKGKDAPLTHKASRKRIQSGKKTVLYFYTPSCGACKMQGPIIDKIKKRHGNAVFKIDASRNREVAISYGVMGVPFVAFIENCEIMKAMAGVQRESTIEGFLKGSEKENGLKNIAGTGKGCVRKKTFEEGGYVSPDYEGLRNESQRKSIGSDKTSASGMGALSDG